MLMSILLIIIVLSGSQKMVFMKSVLNIFETFSLGLTAVSYTHLDVYKRQILDSTFFIFFLHLWQWTNCSMMNSFNYIKFLFFFYTLNFCSTFFSYINSELKMDPSIAVFNQIRECAFKEFKNIKELEFNKQYKICLLYTSRCV